MTKMSVIEHAHTEWAAPIIFAPKNDGTLRFCVVYQKLNAVSVGDAYPLPRIDECIDSLGDATVFPNVDANCSYWQIEIEGSDRDKTEFTSHHGPHRSVQMPFGVKNAPGTFQREIDVILATVQWQHSLVYLDDGGIFSKSAADHVGHVKSVLTLVQEGVVTLKLKKFVFFSGTID